MTTKRCRKCHQTLPATDEFFYRDLGVLANTCKTCRNARSKELHEIGPVVNPDEPIIKFEPATCRCQCCGFMMADIDDLWADKSRRLCRICANPIVPIKVVHYETR